MFVYLFFFKQKTAYEMRISDWSSDVCSSDLAPVFWVQDGAIAAMCIAIALIVWIMPERWWPGHVLEWADAVGLAGYAVFGTAKAMAWGVPPAPALMMGVITGCVGGTIRDVLAGVPSIIMRPEIYVTAAALASGLYLLLLWRSEEHTSELQSIMRISYAVFCLTKNTKN